MVLRRKKLGADHTETLLSLSDLGTVYQQVGRPQDAVDTFEETYRLTEKKHGPDHPATNKARGFLARAYFIAGQPAKGLLILDCRIGPLAGDCVGLGLGQDEGHLVELNALLPWAIVPNCHANRHQQPTGE